VLNVFDKGFKAHLACFEAGKQSVLQAAIRDSAVNAGRLSPLEGMRQAWIGSTRSINEQVISRCFLFGYLSDGLELRANMQWAEIMFKNIAAQCNVTFESFQPLRYPAGEC
jgi:hypothetical protein